MHERNGTSSLFSIYEKGLGRAQPSLPWRVFCRTGRAASRRRPGMARPVRNPAGLEPAPTHTHPLSARANGCMRTRIPIEEGAEEPRRARLKARFISNRRRRTMTLQTVTLSSLEPGRSNPRKAMDRNGLEGLAASIRNDGLLQHL